ncbi:MAG: PhzF family phenazine biosynthesis protein, partial [Oceanospirillaceae bacterium]|nr:PhzF family phenazine biosynthesis protein [Oceanospirillaceae bacterium]
LYQVDAFTNQPFSGNPAAVCPVQTFPTESLTLRHFASFEDFDTICCGIVVAEWLDFRCYGDCYDNCSFCCYSSRGIGSREKNSSSCSFDCLHIT